MERLAPRARTAARHRAALLLSLPLVAALGGLGGPAARTALAAEGKALRYRFEEGRKSTYELKVELGVATTAQKGEQKDRSTTDTELTLLMDAVEHVTGEGDGATNTLAVTFRELELQQKIDGPAGELTLEIEGEEVKLERRGIVVVDTKEGTGKDLAKGLLAEFAFIGQEGTLTVEPSGRVSDVSGPEEFRSFLAAETGAGLFVLETRPEPVTKGSTWKSEERVVSRLRELDISSRPLRIGLDYEVEEITEGEGGTVAKIAVKSAFLEKGLSGTVAKEALRHAPVTISEVERKLEGFVRFDVARGGVVESDVHVKKLRVQAELTVRDRSTGDRETVSTEMTGTARVRLKLVETASETAVETAVETAIETGRAEAPAAAGGGEEAGGGEGAGAGN